MPLGGFQFNVTGVNILSASGGSAADYQFNVSAGGGTVLGFSLTGATIPAGDQLLTNLVIENSDFSEMCIEDAVLSDSIGGQIDTSVGDCINIPSSQVQIIHNSASPTVDVYVDGGLAIEGFEYRTATGVLPCQHHSSRYCSCWWR